MKSMLYIGATLMMGASIYGFVDYKNTSRKKEFRSLYDEKETTVPVLSSGKEITNSPTMIMAVVKEKTPITLKKKEIIQIGQPLKEKTATIKKEKKLSYKLFSRAPLDRRYLDNEPKLEEISKLVPIKIVHADSLKENEEY